MMANGGKRGGKGRPGVETEANERVAPPGVETEANEGKFEREGVSPSS
jgi:hypothetical protein